MIRTLCRLPVALLLCCVTAAGAVAHPDIAVTARLLFEVKGGRLTMIAERFAFDAGHSRRLLFGFDVDADGHFDEGEMAALGKSLAADLQPLGYFTEVLDGGRPLALPAPSAFHATSEGGIVTVTLGFVLDQAPELGAGRTIELVLRDRDYTAAFRLADQAPVVIRGDVEACGYRLQHRSDLAYFGGLVVPQAVVISCR